MRNIGIAVERMMAKRFRGDPARMREELGKWTVKNLGFSSHVGSTTEGRARQNFGMVLGLMPGFKSWRSAEKSLLAEIIQAKTDKSDSGYALQLLESAAFRQAMLRIGCNTIKKLSSRSRARYEHA